MTVLEPTWPRVLSALERLGKNPKKEHDGWWRMNSPFRTDADSRSFGIHIRDDEMGGYIDQSHGETGTLYQLADFLGIVPAAYPDKQPYRNLKEYAAAHHVPEQAFLDANWEFWPADWRGDRERNYHGRPCLRWQVNTRQGLKWHYRFLDGAKPKFKWEYGGRDGWYGLSRGVRDAKEKGLDFLLYVNGEASTVVGQYYGLPAVAYAGGEGHFGEAAIAELRKQWTGEVWVALDADSTGRKFSLQVASILRQAGYVVRIIRIQMDNHQDVADVCGLWTDTALDMLKRWTLDEAGEEKLAADVRKEQEEMQERMQAEKEKARLAGQQTLAVAPTMSFVENNQQHPAIIMFADLASTTERQIVEAAANPQDMIGFKTYLKPLDDLTGGLSDGIVVLLGAAGMGKSRLAIHITSALLQQGPGLVVPTETVPVTWMRRLTASRNGSHARKLQLGKETPENVAKAIATLHHYSQMEAAMMGKIDPTPEDVREMLRMGIDRYGWEWVVIDSASNLSVLGVPPGDIYAKTVHIYEILMEIAREFGIPLIVTHQTNRATSLRGDSHHEPRLEDAEGGAKIGQAAKNVIGIYDNNYYVTQGMAKENLTRYPDNTVTLINLKDKDDNPVKRGILSMVAGGGFADIPLKRVHAKFDEATLNRLSIIEAARNDHDQRKELLINGRSEIAP